VVVFMDPHAAVIDGWYTRQAAIERLHDYRAAPEYAAYGDDDQMVIVMLDTKAD
jgi:hypothetical protein